MTDWNDKEQVIKAVTEDGLLLENASDELRADSEIVLAAVQEDGRALKYASDEFKANREVVMAAVQRNGWALEYANDELKADREIVLAAVQRSGTVLQYAGKELRTDPEIRRQAGKELQTLTDRDSVLAALRLDIYPPTTELLNSNVRKNIPTEFQALSQRWDECLEKIVTAVCNLTEGEQQDLIDEDKMGFANSDCIPGLFQKFGWSWEPTLKKELFEEADRLGQHFKGPMYTCEEYPWPKDKEGIFCPPSLQIDLDEVSSLAGADIGGGFLQLFYRGEIEDYPNCDYLLRRIPRASISKEKMTPLPEDLGEFNQFELTGQSYTTCSLITAFKKGNSFEAFNKFDRDGVCPFYELADELRPSDSPELNLIADELEKLADDLDSLWGTNYADCADRSNTLYQLFGVYNSRDEEPQMAADTFFVVHTDEIPSRIKDNDSWQYGGVIRIKGRNDFTWYFDYGD